jgi:heme/copper-type cytochrome/quinol oxidase subunit 1
MAKRTGREVIGWVAAGTLVVAGVITIVVGQSSPVTFGWFAYQPLADATFMPGGDAVIVARATVTGFVVCALGLVSLAFLAGWRLGKKSTS